MKRIYVYSLLLFLALLISCSKTGKDDVSENIYQTDNDTMSVVSFTKDPVALNPIHAVDGNSCEVFTCIFDPLIYFDSEGQIKYSLATEYKILTPTLIQFKLRKGVKFHNGEQFNAGSVKTTFDLMADPAVKSPTWIMLNTIKEVTIVDDYTVNIKTHKPDGLFLNRLHMFGSIVPPEYIKKHGLEHFRKHPVGTGPFKYVSWSKGKNIVLEKNENYWNPAVPKVKKFVFNIIPENKWIEMLAKNKIDFCMYLNGKDASLIETNVTTKIMRRKTLSAHWVLFKNHGPFSNINVRKAVNMAINREELIKYADYGYGTPLASMGKIGEFGFNPDLKPYEYNIEKAKKLLKQANYENGFTVKVLVTDVSKRVAEYLKMQLKAINVNLDLKIIPRGEYVKAIGKKNGLSEFDGDMCINQIGNPTINLAFHLNILLHSGGQFGLWSDPALDKKIEWAIGTSDRTEHEKRLKELDKYVYDNALILSTYQREYTPGMNRNVQLPAINVSGHYSYQMMSEIYKTY